MDGGKSGRRKSVGGKKDLPKARFAESSPMVCETYGATEYDRAYTSMPSPVPGVTFTEGAGEGIGAVEEVDVPVEPPPPSPIIMQEKKKARRGKRVGDDDEAPSVPLRARRTNKV
jgi:hypothetical protein